MFIVLQKVIIIFNIIHLFDGKYTKSLNTMI